MRDRVVVWLAITLGVSSSGFDSRSVAAARPPSVPPERILFSDDFESGLDAWTISDPAAIVTIDSGDSVRGKVMLLSPRGARLHALMKGSEQWHGYRIEGDVLFPDDVHNYLGVLYNYTETDGRVEVGSIYLKGNGSYVRVNPRYDWNPARALYEEFRVDLEGDEAIRIGHWHRFAVEVYRYICHFYVDDFTIPKVTFEFFQHESGEAGFKPRVVGGPVWIDNVRVMDIDRLSYHGTPRPDGIRYRPRRALKGWTVLGPLTRAFPDEVEGRSGPFVGSVVDNGAQVAWRPFKTDPRGAVITGRVTDFLGSRTVAYFATRIHVGENERAMLHFSTVDNLAVWLDGKFQGYWDRGRFAWYDFGDNPEHPLEPDPVTVPAGVHHVLVRVRGGQYATGGFFARVVREGETPRKRRRR